MQSHEAARCAEPISKAAEQAWPQLQERKQSSSTTQPWPKCEPKEGSVSDPSTQETHRSSLTARPMQRSSRRSERPPSPFEALLAVSSNACSDLPLSGPPAVSLPISATQGLQAQPLQQELLSQRLATSIAQNGGSPPARSSSKKREREIQEEHPEGVGTSGGGEMGDTDDSSGNSKHQVMDMYVHEECSGVEKGMRGEGGWSAKSRNAKKARMVWTHELHQRFVNAVNHLGLKNAVPKTILKMMNVDGMTRENVASHLQKYRLHLKRQNGAEGAMLLGTPADQASGVAASGMVQGVPVTQALLMGAQMPTYDALAVGIPVDQAYGQISGTSTAMLAPWLADSLTYPPFPGVSGALTCQQSAALQLMSLQTPREQLWAGAGLSEPLQAEISQGLTAVATRISEGLMPGLSANLAIGHQAGMLDITPLDYSPPLPPAFGN